MNLEREIETIAGKGNYDPQVSTAFIARMREGKPTRDENPTSHFCVYFAACNPDTQEVFLGHHKKSGLWLFNGGHIDPNESTTDTLLREMDEEWGVQYAPDSTPFLITVTEIVSNPSGRPCRHHYDVWYRIPIRGRATFDDGKLAIEFHESRWMSIADAQKLVTDPSTLKALSALATP